MPSRMVLAAVTAIGLTAAVPSATAAGGARHSTLVSGLFSYQIFQGAGCSSPVKLCVHGTFAGPLAGRFDEVITGLTPTKQKSIALGVGRIVIHTGRGDLPCTESFVFNTAKGSDSEAGIVCEFTGATGRLTGARGYFTAWGTQRPGQAVGLGHYGGRLTLP
jgi:hypothetical protein